MVSLRLTLFGSPQIELNNNLVQLKNRKAVALLAYLVLSQLPQSREKLVSVFWPEFSSDRAFANLRETLRVLKKHLTDDWLDIRRQEVEIKDISTFWADVLEFQQHVHHVNGHDPGLSTTCAQCLPLLLTAIELYRDDFLRGFTLPDSPAFDEWQTFHTDLLRENLSESLHRVVRYYTRHHQLLPAIEYARRWIAFFPWSEPAHRELMRVYGLNHQRSAALQQYQECAQMLQKEFGVEPEHETQELYEAILKEELTPRPPLLGREGEKKEGGRIAVPPLSFQERGPGGEFDVPNNLPAQITSFIGRETEVSTVSRMLCRPDVRLLTLTGPGGVGKTRLSLQVAEMMLAEMMDGVFFVSLAPISNPDLVISTIAKTLGLYVAGNASPLMVLKAYLQKKQLLLILDNFEQITPAAPVLIDLLAAAAGVKILVTSRTVLRISGEHTYLVPPLRVPDLGNLPSFRELTRFEAIRLFTERTNAVNMDFTLTEENAPTVAEICARLHGLPLAIELAAAHVNMFSPKAMLEQLDSPLHFLTGGARDLPTRQQTLRNTIVWSYDLLKPEEQMVFRRLAVFVGGWTLTAAEAVCTMTDEVNVFDTLQALVDQHLITMSDINGEPRFSLLETIREYALECLTESGETDKIQQQHAQFFLALAEKTEPDIYMMEQLDRLDMELHNFRRVLTWSLNHAIEMGVRLAAALGEFWTLRSVYFQEGHEWLMKALTQHQAYPPEFRKYRAKALYEAGRLCGWRGDLTTAKMLLEESVALCQTLNDIPGLARAFRQLGNTLKNRVKGRSLVEDSLALYRQIDDPHELAKTLHVYGLVVCEQGDFEQAVSSARECIAIAQGINDVQSLARGTSLLADCVSIQGDYDTALSLYEKSLTLFQNMTDKVGIAITLSSLGHVLYAQGQNEQARTCYADSLKIFQELNVLYLIFAAGSCQGLRYLSLRQHRWQEGHMYFTKNLQWERRDCRGIRSSLVGMAGVAEGQERLERAAQLLGAAEALPVHWIMSVFQPEHERIIASVHSALGEKVFEAEVAKGRAMTLDEAIALALEGQQAKKGGTAMTDWIGKQIGKYTLKALLGRGGMGAVYKAYQPVLERDVAIKLIHTHLIGDPEVLTRFRREAKVIAALRHPGIVRVYDFDVEGEMLYMVMELVPGESLQQHLSALHTQGAWLPLPTALSLFRMVTDAVAYAHAQGIIHRDLKPANILLSPEETPILVDFGLSKLLSGEQVTMPGMTLGSPQYMSPEQGAGRDSDARSDVYSLGVILYELSTGILPFTGDTPVGIMLKHISEPPAPPRSINPNVPERVEQIIHIALSKEPADRYPSAREMLDALDSVELPPFDNTLTLETPVVAPSGSTITQTPDTSPKDERCPYRGLQTFEAEHAEFFFGREALITQLVTTLATLHPSDSSAVEGGNAPIRFLAVIGASGSGKSSLVRAGLVPALQHGALPGSDQWTVVMLKPGSRPLEELATRIAPVLYERAEQLTATRHLLDNLMDDGRALRLAWKTKSPGQVLVLIVDQFEEIFTLCQDETERHRFIENLLYAASSEGEVMIVLTMRADFYHRCAAYRDLATRISAQQVLVGPMNEAELRRAIERPAHQVGLRFEPGLVDMMLADVAQQSGALPLLQHALLELWEQRKSGVLTVQAYRDSGGVAGAIAQRAEVVYAGFTGEEQAIVRHILLHLIQLGEGTEDTRRRVRKAELLPHTAQAADVESVILRLADARLVTTTRDLVSGAEHVDVAHEALIREWERLRQWLDEDREFLLWQQRLRTMVQQWQQSRQDEGALLRGTPLGEAENWMNQRAGDLSETERTFIQASLDLRKQIMAEREAQQRRELEAAQKLAEEQTKAATQRARAARRLRWLAVGLAIFLIVAIGAAFFAAQQTQRAEQQTQRAEQQTRLTFARELAGTAMNNLDVDPERSILLALQAVDATYAHDNMVTREAEEALHRAIQTSRVRFTFRHAGSVAEVDISPDGTRLATASFDKTAKVWDLSTGRELLTLTGHSDIVFGVVFSPNGTRLATGSYDGTAKVWDLEASAAAGSGQELLTLSGHSAEINGVVFSPDGTRIATASFDKTAKVWDATTGQELFTLVGHQHQVWNVNFSPDGTRLATGSVDGTAKLWDAATGRELLTLTGHTGFVSRVAFSPDGRYLATSSQDMTAKIWDTKSGQEVLTLTGHTCVLLYVRFSPDGTRLATAGEDGTKLWLLESSDGDIVSARELLTLAGHTGLVLGVDFSPDGTRLATGSYDGTAKVWDISPARELFTLNAHTAVVFGLAFSPDGTRLATASLDGTAKVWDISAMLNTGISTLVSSASVENINTDAASVQELFTLSGHTGEVYSVAFSPDGRRVVTAGADQTAKIWDLEALAAGTAGQELFTLTGHRADSRGTAYSGLNLGVTGVAFSPDGARLATASSDTTAKVWDTKTGRELLTLTGHAAYAPGGSGLPFHGVADVVFSPDGTRLATAGADGSVRVWDAATGAELLTLVSGIGMISDIDFNPDGSRLAIADWTEGLIKVWEISQALDTGLEASATAIMGQELFSVAGHSGPIYGLTFSPDGTYLATAGQDKTARVWDAETGQELLILTGPSNLWDVAFSPDGKYLATANQDGTVRFYVLPIDELVALARSRVTRSLTTEECRQYLHVEECPTSP